MGLADVVRGAVATANTVTRDLQASVTHFAWTSQSDTGAPVYASGVSRKAIVEMKQRLMRTAGGQEIVARAKVTFLELPAANGAANRREPIDPRDKILLPDGTTGPILDVAGLVDAESTAGRSFFAEVWLS